MIRLKINDQICESEEGSTIIEVADRYGIAIPRFCYHSELSIAANCRMCLVEVSNSLRPVPACATPISEGVEVYTKSLKTKEAQQSVLEFLLINHPLDCPICDQGGECELQDLSLGYGFDRSNYHEEKRQVETLNLGSLVATEMNRCIHCTRCVRFGTEISGMREIGALGRGESTLISNALHKNLRSSISANIIDLCPVGALTSKPHRYQGRTWQYKSFSTIAYHDPGRSRMSAHVFKGQIRRMTSKGIVGSKDYWLSDRDRFGFLGMQTDRFQRPMIWHNKAWVPLSWNQLYAKLSGLQKEYRHWAAWFHPMSTQEEKQALKAYLTHLHSPQGVFDLQHRKFETIGQEEVQWSSVQSVLLIGSFWESQHPVLLVSLRQWANRDSRKISQFGFIKEDLQIPSLTQEVIAPEFWELAVKIWLNTTSSESSYVIINAQVFNESVDRLEALISLFKQNCVTYTLLGIEAPLKKSDQSFRARLCGSVEALMTLHLEKEDWTQDRILRSVSECAKVLITFTAMLPKKAVKDGQICIPIAAPGEYEGSYESLWNRDPLFSERVINPPENVIAFNTLIQQWLSEAPIIPRVRPISLRSQGLEKSGDIYKDVATHTFAQRTSNLTLLVLKNPMALNMIVRRSLPLQNTPTALEQVGFWVSKEQVSLLCKQIVVQDNLGQIHQDSVSIVMDLPSGLILYWTGLNAEEPLWGSHCIILEEIL